MTFPLQPFGEPNSVGSEAGLVPYSMLLLDSLLGDFAKDSESFSAAFCTQEHLLRSSSHRARRSSSSCVGLRRALFGAGLLGTQGTLALFCIVSIVLLDSGLSSGLLTLMQNEQGPLWSHFFLRCWQRTQARILCAGFGLCDS